MQRRHYLILQAGLLAGTAMADTPKVQTLDQALQWLDRLERAKEARMKEMLAADQRTAEESMAGKTAGRGVRRTT